VLFGRTAAQDLDDALIARATAGDEGAFARLYDTYYDRVFRYVLYRVGRVEDAEDLAQKVFLQAWRALGRYHRTEAPFVAWLLTIAHNSTVSFFRSQRPADTLEFDVVDRSPWHDPDTTLESRYEQERIRKAILELSSDQQQVVTMHFLEDFGYPDIAAALGKSEGNVRVIQHRALQQLRKFLGKEAR
jgi:RNA polymerase sigma-70 factor (ECF subfamily)